MKLKMNRTAIKHHQSTMICEEEEIEDIPLRRSTRVSKAPAYLNDYIYLAEIEGERLLLIIDEEPWSFKDAVEEKVWRDACRDEIAFI